MSIKERINKFRTEHPAITKAVIVTGTLATITAIAALNGQARKKYSTESEHAAQCPENFEKYEENWNLVEEFAKQLKLLPGESFFIEEPSQYGAGEYGDEPIISHLVNGIGVYPTEF